MLPRVTPTIQGNWRVLIRFSLDDDKGSKIRNALKRDLESGGICRTKTGTWESKEPHLTPDAAVKQLNRVLTKLSNPRHNVSGVHPWAKLDHIWFYIERVRL